MSTFLDLLDGVSAYYGSGSDEWVKIATGGVTPQTIPIIQQVPGVTITRSASGKILGYDYLNPFPQAADPASVINSNVQTGSYGLTSFNASVPATAVTDAQTGVTTLQSGAVVRSTGQTLATIADRASLAFAGVALGSKLGLAIDSALYSANPQWWDEHYPAMNPATWQTLVPDNAAGNVVRGLLGIGSDSATMYMDERILAYTYMTLLQAGAWNGGGEGTSDYDGDTTGLDMDGIVLPMDIDTLGIMRISSSGNTCTMTSTAPRTVYYEHYNTSGYPAPFWECEMVAAGLTNDFHIHVKSEPVYPSEDDYYPRQVTVKGQTFYYAYVSRVGRTTSPANAFTASGSIDAPTVAYILLFGEHVPGAIPGSEENPDASIHMVPADVINPTTGQPVTPADDIGDVVDALKTAYPDLFQDEAYEDVYQDDGTVERIYYIPVPYPTTDQAGNPVTDLTPGVDPQTDPQITEDVRPDAADNIIDTTSTPPAPPDTGSGSTPPAVVPTGSASALYSIYNPTTAELSSFGAWLWSSNFVDQLLKLFSDPMQAIIGLHKVFCTPPVSGRGNIKVGYLDSGVATNLVSGQYVTISCGSVNLNEYFGNVMDYDPYTRVQIYLPFVGIQPLDTGDVMRGTLTVTYHIDVLTGACLAEVSVARDGAGGILYTYAGNAAVQYPVSSGSYMGILSTVVSMAGGIAGTIASGGALAPLAMGAASGILSARTRVQHSGGFSGNAGAMGARIPYLIVTRPQSALAMRFEDYEGYPSNFTTTLGACSGYIRCKVAHLEGIPATSGELAELEALLAEGVII